MPTTNKCEFVKEEILASFKIPESTRAKLDEMTEEQLNAVKTAFADSAWELFKQIDLDIFLNGYANKDMLERRYKPKIAGMISGE